MKLKGKLKVTKWVKNIIMMMVTKVNNQQVEILYTKDGRNKSKNV